MDRAVRQYVRQLEDALARRSEGPRVFTQRDYRLALRWCREGVPAGLIREILDRRRTGARSLSQIATRVDESWNTVRTGELQDGDRPPAPTAESEGPEAELLAASAAAPPASRMRILLESLLAAVRAGDPPEQLERMLEADLPETVTTEQLRQAEEETRHSLERHKDRMPPEALRETVRKGALARLRRAAGIPRFR